jgi:tripartite-type tricarboxylate transporter receptor subunit TctC
MRIVFTILFILSVSLGCFSNVAWAQAYPTKPIKVIVPFPPGDTTDIMSRLIGPKIQERLGQPFIVENRPGASGMLGLSLVAKSAPDGYTIGAGQGGNLSVLPHTRKNVPYNALKDFAPISISITNYLVIFANIDQPFKTLPEMIAYAKANPGKLTVAHNGEGGFPHLAFEHLRLMAGFTYNGIPYKGSAQICTDVIGGQVQVGILGAAVPTPHIKAGRLTLLAPTGPARASTWPDKPTAGETVPGYASGGWFGYVAPAGTPKEIITKLNEEINRAMKSPDVAEKINATNQIVVAEPVKHAEDVVKNDYEKYGKLVRDIGFQPQ